jgi:pimeloyl-ACP methyl ester carboxylesterase
MPTQTLEVPHLNGITASYQTPAPISPSKPTLILVNSFGTSSELYRDVFANTALTSAMNLVAIELLGHGQTRTHTAQHWTYWDTAIMNLQVMSKLGIDKAFVLGTSQGGWVTVRMALLEPERVSFIYTQFLHSSLPHTPYFHTHQILQATTRVCV